MTGSYSTGLFIVSAAFLVGVAVLLELGAVWSRRWAPEAIRQAGIYSYRGVLRDQIEQA
jgi:hypothetical protein